MEVGLGDYTCGALLFPSLGGHYLCPGSVGWLVHVSASPHHGEAKCTGGLEFVGGCNLLVHVVQACLLLWGMGTTSALWVGLLTWETEDAACPAQACLLVWIEDTTHPESVCLPA